MKPGILLTIGMVLLKAAPIHAQSNPKEKPIAATASSITVARTTKNRMNFFVISKPKKLLDPPTRFNILRAKIKSMLRPKKFSCIVAGSASQMSEKVKYRLQKRNAMIGSLWFDSHGSYAKGYSLFTVGHDEFHFRNMNDTERLKPLLNLAAYCDSSSKIGIGSCYGGATYSKPSDTCSPAQRMYGDSLMKRLGSIFSTATIYACESWVMTKPGLFKEKFAMAGYPLRKKFKDSSFEPVWNTLGMWNSYQAVTDEIRAVNCVTLSKYGDIKIRFNSYQSLEKVKKKIAQQKTKLRPNLLKV